MLGMTLNRDEVRTPMQWNGEKNGGFSSAEKTWLPVHPNYVDINVEKEINEANSLANTIRALLRIRSENPALSNGSLELINDLPDGVLGYIRRINENEIAVLLNFVDEEKIVGFRDRNWQEVLKLLDDEITGGIIQLKGFSGVILQGQKSECNFNFYKQPQ